jgi:hypothetical protein
MGEWMYHSDYKQYLQQKMSYYGLHMTAVAESVAMKVTTAATGNHH